LSTESGAPVAEARHQPHHAPAVAERPQPAAAVYVLGAIFLIALTWVEWGMLSWPDATAELNALLIIGVLVASLFLVGLWYEEALFKVTYAFGLFFGLICFLGVKVLVDLGHVLPVHP
jgi:hypothetical protein